MKKVAIFGNAGGGKSTLARKLAEIIQLPLHPLDTIKFLPGGAEISHDDYRSKHKLLLSGSEWIIDGFGDAATAWQRFAGEQSDPDEFIKKLSGSMAVPSTTDAQVSAIRSGPDRQQTGLSPEIGIGHPFVSTGRPTGASVGIKTYGCGWTAQRLKSGFDQIEAFQFINRA